MKLAAAVVVFVVVAWFLWKLWFPDTDITDEPGIVDDLASPDIEAGVVSGEPEPSARAAKKAAKKAARQRRAAEKNARRAERVKGAAGRKAAKKSKGTPQGSSAKKRLKSDKSLPGASYIDALLPPERPLPPEDPEVEVVVPEPSVVVAEPVADAPETPLVVPGPAVQDTGAGPVGVVPSDLLEITEANAPETTTPAATDLFISDDDLFANSGPAFPGPPPVAATSAALVAGQPHVPVAISVPVGISANTVPDGRQNRRLSRKQAKLDKAQMAKRQKASKAASVAAAKQAKAEAKSAARQQKLDARAAAKQAKVDARLVTSQAKAAARDAAKKAKHVAVPVPQVREVYPPAGQTGPMPSAADDLWASAAAAAPPVMNRRDLAEPVPTRPVLPTQEPAASKSQHDEWTATAAISPVHDVVLDPPTPTVHAADGWADASAGIDWASTAPLPEPVQPAVVPAASLLQHTEVDHRSVGLPEPIPPRNSHVAQDVTVSEDD